MLDAFRDRIRRIDDLEERVDARAVRARRRIATVLENRARNSHRRSHLRLWVTHSLVEKKEPPPPFDPLTVLPPQPPKQEWRLLIEGKLLVGHLDHESAFEHDKKTGYVAPQEELERAKAEAEELDVNASQFTHFFDRVEVRFDSVFQPKPNPMSKKKKPVPVSSALTSPSAQKKSSRRGSSTPTSAEPAEEEVDPAVLVTGDRTDFAWTRDMSPDTNAWQVKYHPPAPPGHHLMPHSFVAHVKLFGRRPDDLYQVSPELAKAMFPFHGVPEKLQQQQQPQQQADMNDDSGRGSKRRKTAELDAATGTSGSGTAGGGAAAAGSDAAGTAAATTATSESSSAAPPRIPTPPPSTPKLETEIHIPQGLTMEEISIAFFHYVRDRNLYDRKHGADKGTVVCDDVLKSLFGTDRFQFHDLQRLLVERNLLTNVSREPISLVYIMKPETATTITTIQPGIDPIVEPPDGKDSERHALLQLDVDAVVPALFPFRCRELMRRIKRRELEYTSSRTKARYILMSRRAKSDDLVKSQIDEVVAGHSLAEHLQPVYAALAKAAPQDTEARGASHIDLRLSYLLGRLREYQSAAESAWTVADALRGSSDGGGDVGDAVVVCGDIVAAESSGANEMIDQGEARGGDAMEE